MPPRKYLSSPNSSPLRQFCSEEQEAENNRFCEKAVAEIKQKTVKSLPFGVPMMWREPQNYVDGCYFCFSKCVLNDLVRDPGLSKVGAETLGSRLQSKHMLAPGTTISIDISGLMFQLGAEKYVANEWKLFIDSAKKSMKGVIPHNGNTYVSVLTSILSSMYGSPYWTRVVSSNDLPIVSADSSHVFSGIPSRLSNIKTKTISKRTPTLYSTRDQLTHTLTD
ncbi:hypothetical protein T07_6250 [Trichinella nelsoni]|uniref:Uncharacterized protein n=1 Tax=Trichinella nelsoni TaxID=6336 RepID=A0A0V0S816_9BILA|nr:hypothetical protein T07_6250 [Trichinella nelsoni]